MSDEIIARIQAPRAARELAGHADAAATLAEAWSGGRFAHAWLIAGPQGIGKATLAWRFARFVLARERRPGADPLAVAPDDPAARQVTAGSHPDIRLVRRDYRKTSPHPFMTEISVDNIRDLGPFLRQTAALGGWRVIIVDAADDMNVNAQNALLKLLEEPPAKTAFLLVCHAPARLLPTIRSRCRTLTLRPLDEATLLPLLGSLLPDLPADETLPLARLAEGAPGRAVDLAEAGGVALFRDLLGLLQTLPELDAVRLHALTDQFGPASGEPAYRTFTVLLTWWLGRSIRLTATHSAPAAEVLQGEGAVLRRLAAVGTAPWLDAWDAIARQLERADAVNLDRKQVAMNAFFGLAEAARSRA
jgi:DNA polymerase-3 subunit delta'